MIIISKMVTLIYHYSISSQLLRLLLFSRFMLNMKVDKGLKPIFFNVISSSLVNLEGTINSFDTKSILNLITDWTIFLKKLCKWNFVFIAGDCYFLHYKYLVVVLLSFLNFLWFSPIYQSVFASSTLLLCCVITHCNEISLKLFQYVVPPFFRIAIMVALSHSDCIPSRFQMFTIGFYQARVHRWRGRKLL